MSVKTAEWLATTVSAGRYQILSKLGEGGMGVVYKGRDLRLDADVVLKVPRRAMLDDPDFSERFQREVRALVKLSHPHVVRVTDLGEHEGLPFAVMQYLSGGSLDDRRPRDEQGGFRPLAPGQLRGWLEQVANALDFIHAQGYVHRDVKPGNIIFDEHGHAYLSDFGVAKVVSESVQGTRAASLTGTGMVLGTPDYMSPELVMGQKIDGRSDQYALAVMVYELLAGRVPFTAATPAAVLVKQATEGAVPLHLAASSVPDALSAAVMRGMEKAPEKRYSTCEEFAQTVIAAAASCLSVALPSGQMRRVKCPSCGKGLRVGAEMVGKKARCPECGNKWQIEASSLGGISTAGTTSIAAVAATTGVLAPIVRQHDAPTPANMQAAAGVDTVSVVERTGNGRRTSTGMPSRVLALGRRRMVQAIGLVTAATSLIVVAGWLFVRSNERNDVRTVAGGDVADVSAGVQSDGATAEESTATSGDSFPDGNAADDGMSEPGGTAPAANDDEDRRNAAAEPSEFPDNSGTRVLLKPKLIENTTYKTKEHNKEKFVIDILQPQVNGPRVRVPSLRWNLDETIIREVVTGRRDVDKKLAMDITCTLNEVSYEDMGVKGRFSSNEPLVKTGNSRADSILDSFRAFKDVSISLRFDSADQIAS
ncbi:MAG TPA: protein kinase, partial [Spirochaetia bacterium]|nr:protein kinase [Spirochaetia bacterium]